MADDKEQLEKDQAYQKVNVKKKELFEPLHKRIIELEVRVKELENGDAQKRKS